MFAMRRAFCLAAAMLIAERSFAQESVAPPTESTALTRSESSAGSAVVTTDESTEVCPADGRRCMGTAELGTRDEFLANSYFTEMLAGRYRSTTIGPKIPKFDYVPLAFRIGCSPMEDGSFFVRHFSFLTEWSVDPITGSFGNIATGPSIMFRFDVCPQQRICPYLQAATGFVLTDAYRDQSQRAVGEEFEFLQQLEVGVRWKMNESLAIESEFGLQHISNAGLASRNFGVNAIGVSIGLRWNFGVEHARY
jgi:Lipid A 3-O-deacylase (PagL)